MGIVGFADACGTFFFRRTPDGNSWCNSSWELRNSNAMYVGIFFVFLQAVHQQEAGLIQMLFRTSQ
jgi:hypothetical protein